MTFQFGALFDSLPIWENVTFRSAPTAKAAKPGPHRDIAVTTVTDLGLEPHVIDQYPAELSGGMQKRVALARAIADKPEILLFDEPTSGLDPITGGVIDRLIIDAVQRLGATTVTISHDMASVRRIADKVAMVHSGVILWCGDVTDMDKSGVPESINSSMVWLRAAHANRGTSTTRPRVMARARSAMSASNAGQHFRNGPANVMIVERGIRLLKNAKTLLLAPASGPWRQIALEPLQNARAPRHCHECNQIFQNLTAWQAGVGAGVSHINGGDPGIGKSTLLLQLTCNLSERGFRAAYISGEESADQVRMRANRLGLANAAVELGTATNASDIAASMTGPDRPDIVVIDSIQTMFLPSLDSAPGTVSQVRASAQELIRAAKNNRVALLIVGHVTKDGAIAGPRVLEHMVDSVLYFEGDRSHHFRILRGVKNRFGATDEIGVFEMVEAGLAEVTNPSELFLADRRDDVTGAVVFAGIEGSRTLLVEIEALVAPSSLATPRRNVVGWDSSRLLC